MNRKNNTLAQIAEAIRQKDGFILIGHVAPDGDCVGSLLGLHQLLQQLGKRNFMLLRDAATAMYRFLPGFEDITSVPTLPEIYENIIFLDCGDKNRAGEEVLQLIQDKANFIINIDHHSTNDGFGDLNYVDANAAATAEILTDLAAALGVELAPAADAFYAAILMDTGNFQYSSTSSHTLRAAATLLEAGADLNRIRIALFESKDCREIQMLAMALRHMQLSEDGKIAWMYLTQEEIRSIHAEDFHPEGLVNYLRSIQGVEAAVYFREKSPAEIKIAFRSKHDFNVADIAVQFGGGGHSQAAGATFHGSLQQAIELVLTCIAKGMKAQ